MIKNFLLGSVALLLAFAFIACSSSDDEEKYVTVNESSFEFSSDGGSDNFTISSNTSWSLATSSQWITVSKQNGSGDSSLSLTVVSNSEYDERTGYVTVMSDDLLSPIKISVKQSQKDAILTSENQFSFDWEGGSKELSYQYNVATEIVVPETATWVHITKTRALSNGTITINVDENNSSQRQCTVTLKGTGISKDITISQEAFIPIESISFQQGTDLLVDTNEKAITLTPVVLPDNASEKSLEWSSSNSEIVEVNQNGEVTIKSNGVATVSVYNKQSGKTASISITVKIKAQSLKLKNEWGGYLGTYCVEGNWGYSFVPQIEVEPANAYIEDLVIVSDNESLVSISGNTIVCNSQNQEGKTRITASLPYSSLSSSFEISVQCCYLKAGLGLIEQDANKFMISFAGLVYSNNTDDKFKIEGISIMNENDQLIATVGTLESDNTNKVRWVSKQINLVDYGMSVIDNTFYNTISQWNVVVMYRYNNSENIISERMDIDTSTQY